MIRDLVARGMGVAMLPGLALGAASVCITRIAGRQPQRRVRVLYRKENTNPLLPIALDCLHRAGVELAGRWAGSGADPEPVPLRTSPQNGRVDVQWHDERVERS